MVSLGHSVTVLAAGFGALQGEANESGMKVVRVASWREREDRSSFKEKGSFLVRAAIALPGLLRRHKPDACIVFFSMPCGPLGRLARALGGKPYVISLRGGDVPGTEAGLDGLHKWLTPVRRWVLRGAASVVANSPGLKALSEKADPFEVAVIPNGVDTEIFIPAQERRPGPYRFLFVGRLNDQKNLALLLAAARRTSRLSKVAFRVTIIGDGPLSGQLHTLSRTLDMEDLVDWHTWVPRANMPAHYGSADCLVNPSLYEGMPNAVLEAMACSLPVIASDVAGNADVVDHELTGLLFPCGDEEALAQAMQWTLEHAKEAESWGKAGRAITQARYSWNSAARSYLQLFR